MSTSLPFPITFMPAANALEVLHRVAQDASSPHQQAAQAAIDGWKESLATPDMIAMVPVDNDLEVDDEGACASIGEDGAWVQCWAHIPWTASDDIA